MTDNPFLFRKDPYAVNPFTILGIRSIDASQDQIDMHADETEKKVRAGLASDLHIGEAGEAASVLKDSLSRLAFEMMNFYSREYREEEP